MSITRYTTRYTGYLSIYVDLNNDGMYTASELVGAMQTLPSTTHTTTYSFRVPSAGIVTGTHLHMRVFLTEVATGAPCSGTFGQTYDYYLQVGCPSFSVISITPASAAICGGSSVGLTIAGAGTGSAYSWSPAAGLSATTGSSVVASPAVTTVYTVSSSSSVGCTGAGTASVTVDPTPSGAVTPTGALNLCIGDSLTFAQPASAGVTYQWYRNSVAVSGATGNTYTDHNSGVISLIMANAIGCKDTVAVGVVTVATATVPVSVSPARDTTLCDSIRLSATTGSGYTYQWYRNDTAISGATGSVYTATATGGYTCGITIPSLCTEFTPRVTDVVHVPPVPLITFGGSTFRTAATYLTYQWYENGVAISGATHDTVLARSNGNYTVSVSDSFGCTTSSAVYALSKLALQQLNTASDISIYPNPATTNLNIIAPSPLDIVIINPLGKTMLQQKAVQTINISPLPAGSYIVELFDAAGRRLLVKKLVKN